MVKWRAVWFGVVVAGLLAFGALVLPLVGHAGVGVAAGFVAGVLAGGGPTAGYQHGTLAGGVTALLVFVVQVALALAAGPAATLSPLETLAPGAEAVLHPVVTAGFGLPAAAGGALLVVVFADTAGALGGYVRGQREFPGRHEEERGRR